MVEGIGVRYRSCLIENEINELRRTGSQDNSRRINDFFAQQFSKSLMSNRTEVKSHTRFCDLTPYDFLLWEYQAEFKF